MEGDTGTLDKAEPSEGVGSSKIEAVGITFGTLGTDSFNASVDPGLERMEFLKIKHHKYGQVLCQVDKIDRRTDLTMRKAKKLSTGLPLAIGEDITAEITVLAWNSDGEISATKNFSLEPNQRRVGMLDESFYFGPGFSQVGGHLEISSDQPVIAFSLYGDYELEYLATIGGQKLNDD